MVFQKKFDSAVRSDKFRFVTVLIDEFRADSICWDLFAAEKDFYYRLYKCHNGAKTRGEFLEDLFIEAYPEAAGYEIEASDGHPQAYRAKSGGDYVCDPAGDFFRVYRRDEAGQIIEAFYIHRSQFFKPVSYALKGMGVIALAMAVAFQNTQIQMSQMADYIREAEMINAKIADLNGLYSDLNLLLSTFTNLGNRYAAVVVYPENNLWRRLANNGFVELDHMIKMGIQFRPVLLQIDLTDGKDWLVFALTYDAVGNKITSKQYPRLQQSGTLEDWVVNTLDEALEQIGENAQPKYTDAETVAAIITLENATVHFEINSAGRLFLGSEAVECYDTWGSAAKWFKGSLIQKHDEQFGGYYDSGYNADPRNDFQIGLSRYHMDNEGKTVRQIVDGKLKSLVRLWDVRKYIDDVRQRIECVNNQLQTANTYMNMINQDIQANFSTATNVLSSVGQQLTQTTKFIRT